MTETASPWLVAGAGAWGTALAVSLGREGRPVYLWGRDPTHLAELRKARENRHHLPGIRLPEAVMPVTDMSELGRPPAVVVLATPLQTTRELLVRLRPLAASGYVCTAKGMDRGSGLLVHEIVADELGAQAQVALVSGPSFAREVAEGRPTALAVAASDRDFGRTVMAGLHGPALRPYLTDDLAGVAVGGAVKNVLAIAAGIADGLDLGANSRAALITRGLAEMARFGTALGGRSETFMGLAGLGDLVLTCTDDQSRNRRLGLALGRGRTLEESRQAIGLVEGAFTAEALMARAAGIGVDMPICAQVARTLQGMCSPADSVRALMSRALRFDG